MDGLPFEERREDIRRAIVLSGGGARGAYEAGALNYVLGELPKRLGFVPRFDVYSGTSVGAVHTCFLAAHADDPAAGVRVLADVWRNMAFSRVYSFGLGDAWSFSKSMLSFVSGSGVSTEGKARLHGLLNTTPLEKLVVEGVPWARLHRNVRTGRFSAVCVSATEVATGRTVCFIEHHGSDAPTWTNDAQLVARRARIAPEHALASAAIPFLFPTVRIGDTFYCDGSLRQQTPLAPALRLGSNRVLVVGLRHGRTASLDEPLAAERVEQLNSAGFLVGKVLDALLIDRLEYDLAQMRVVNRILRAGVELYGDEHLERVNEQVKKQRGLGFRIVEDCLIRPSRDIGAIAAKHVARVRAKPDRSLLGRFAFSMLTRGSPENEADLMSYLLFDGAYASELMELGYSDAAAMESELIRFFTT